MGLTLAIWEFLDISYEAFDIGCGMCFFLQALFDFHYEILHNLFNVLIFEDQLLALILDLKREEGEIGNYSTNPDRVVFQNTKLFLIQRSTKGRSKLYLNFGREIIYIIWFMLLIHLRYSRNFREINRKTTYYCELLQSYLYCDPYCQDC